LDDGRDCVLECGSLWPDFGYYAILNNLSLADEHFSVVSQRLGTGVEEHRALGWLRREHDGAIFLVDTKSGQQRRVRCLEVRGLGGATCR